MIRKSWFQETSGDNVIIVCNPNRFQGIATKDKIVSGVFGSNPNCSLLHYSLYSNLITSHCLQALSLPQWSWLSSNRIRRCHWLNVMLLVIKWKLGKKVEVLHPSQWIGPQLGTKSDGSASWSLLISKHEWISLFFLFDFFGHSRNLKNTIMMGIHRGIWHHADWRRRNDRARTALLEMKLEAALVK